MLYPHYCDKCDFETDVVKPMADSSKKEYCPGCANHMRRIYTAPYLVGTSVESAEFNPGLGQVTFGKKDREEKAKRKGMIEIGNDFKTPDSQHDHYDKARERKREANWEKD